MIKITTGPNKRINKFISDLMSFFLLAADLDELTDKPISMTLDLNEFINGLNAGVEYPADSLLYLCNKGISNAQIQSIAKALLSRRCPPGLHIDLSQNKISDAAGIQAIADALSSGQCPQRLQINFDNNDISDAGAKAFAAALLSGNCPPGLRIGLAGNKIPDAGATAIANALSSKQCPPGLKISLSDNLIGETAMAILKKGWAAYDKHQQDNFLKWVALQAGRLQEDCIWNRFPQEILDLIFQFVLLGTPQFFADKRTVISAKALAETCKKEELEPALVKDLEKAFEEKNISQQVGAVAKTIKKYGDKVSLNENTQKIGALLAKFRLDGTTEIDKKQTDISKSSDSNPVTMENPSDTNAGPTL